MRSGTNRLHRKKNFSQAAARKHPYIYLSVDGDDLIFQITPLFITDIEFDYIDPNPMGSKLTEFFQTVERKT